MVLERAVDPALAGRLFPQGSERTLYLARVAWPGAVGEELSRRTEVLALEGPTLRVMVPSGGWKKVLHRLAPQILSRLRKTMGELAPKRLGLTEGLPAAPESTAAPPAALSHRPAPPASVAEAAEQIDDPEIRRMFLEAAGAYLERRSRHA